MNRNTPTGVGKTNNEYAATLYRKKHPHGRGEDDGRLRTCHHVSETPPRAWGRPAMAAAAGGTCGNTPTGVGKTAARLRSPRSVWKHPHGRGEDYPTSINPTGETETPPRAWGRLLRGFCGKTGKRNTPTGVGKTARSASYVATQRKHPHGRGEDQTHSTRAFCELETPPRAWGRREKHGERGW